MPLFGDGPTAGTFRPFISRKPLLPAVPSDENVWHQSAPGDHARLVWQAKREGVVDGFDGHEVGFVHLGEMDCFLYF